MKGSTYQKYPIYPREGIKPRYDESGNPNSDHSNSEKHTENYEDKEEPSIF